MLTQEDDIDAHALRKRGWSISAIARHLGRDRKTIRAYLSGERTAGVRAPAGEDVVRAVRHVLPGTTQRGPAPVGDRVVRRGHRVGLRPVLPAVHAQPAGPRAPPGVRAVPPGDRPAGRDHRSPRWGGNPMGLGGSAESTGRVGRLRPDRASPRRGVVAFREMAGCARREHRPTAPGRRPTPGGHRAGRGDQGVAVRPDVDRGAPGHREGHHVLRRGRETLWGAGQTLPAAAREPQGCGRESEPHRGATLVAHAARRRHRRAGPSPPRRVLRGEDRHPGPGRRRHRDSLQCWCSRRRGAVATRPGGGVPGGGGGAAHGHRAGPGVLPREPVLGATGADPVGRDSASTAWAPRCCRSSPAAVSSSRCTTGSPTAPAPRCGPTPMSPH